MKDISGILGGFLLGVYLGIAGMNFAYYHLQSKKAFELSESPIFVQYKKELCDYADFCSRAKWLPQIDFFRHNNIEGIMKNLLIRKELEQQKKHKIYSHREKSEI